MSRPTLYYTFGNHMHWVDMEWLWGYHVLPGSVRDMIRLCREADVKGCVNFDGIGYEKLAAEDPEALAELREAVQEGIVEPVGCSYGQPYGLFHGGESNVRQLIYGARAVRRLLGVWPKTFWEEEFYFFPQLPQMLAGCGFTGASLFFQWTWHTPDVPKEESPVIWWEGLDGTRILAATRNKLNMHQWPEDMDAVLKGLEGQGSKDEAGGIDPRPSTFDPLIQQWLELMPSPDWMCRSELILPKLKELLSDPRFEIRPVTLGEYLRELGRDAQATIPVRPYMMDQVWHGLTLGKNGDRVRRRSREMEQSLQAMESLSAVLGLFGRPYAQWDVYPIWELEELWRDLLWTQHHDIDECEGLCGYVADGEAEGMRGRIGHLDWNIAASLRPSEQWGRFNPHGWEVGGIGAYGFGPEVVAPRHKWNVDDAFKVASCEWDGLVAKVDLETGSLTEIRLKDGYNLLASPLSLIATRRNESVVENLEVGVDWASLFVSCLIDGESYAIHCMPVTGKGLNLYPSRQRTSRKEGGYRGAHRLKFDLALGDAEITTDTPYGAVLVEGSSAGSRKYPEGDWMTSSQWFEEVEGGFTGGSFVAFREQDGGRGLLVSQTASTQWFRHEGRYEMVCAAYDPWDEDSFHDEDNRVFNLIPIGRQSNADCWKVANTQREPTGVPYSRQLPWTLKCNPNNVVVTAFYREAEDFAGKHVENYAGRGMGYPFIVRLVEFDGIESDVELSIVGPVAKAYKTNLLGQIESEITPESSPPNHPSQDEPLGEGGFVYDTLRFHMRPHEIATLYLDIVPGRKQTRDLDAKREIWATVHRVD